VEQLLEALSRLLEGPRCQLRCFANVHVPVLPFSSSYSMQVLMLASSMSPLLLAASMDECSSSSSSSGEGTIKDVTDQGAAAAKAAAVAIPMLLCLERLQCDEIDCDSGIMVHATVGGTAAAHLASKAARLLLQSAKQLEAAMVTISSGSGYSCSSSEDSSGDDDDSSSSMFNNLEKFVKSGSA